MYEGPILEVRQITATDPDPDQTCLMELLFALA